MTATTTNLDVLNRSTYRRDDVVTFYKDVNALLPAERVILDELANEFAGKKILDIGVGGGRTTPFLLDISEDYTAIDYAEEMAKGTAAKYPNAKVLQMDATNMSEFEDSSFDFVTFTYNGLDSVSHESRIKIISEVNRVLKPGGRFMFSSHNRDYVNFNKLPWRWNVKWDLKFAIFVLHCLYHLPKHYKMKKHEVFAEDYAIVNDGDHRFSLMLYYIGQAKQVKQLRDAGFSITTVYDIEGRQTDNDSVSHWLHYVAQKSEVTVAAAAEETKEDQPNHTTSFPSFGLGIRSILFAEIIPFEFLTHLA